MSPSEEDVLGVSCSPCARDVCANCGKDGSGTVKLKNCTACCLVKYCGVDCQKVHRKKHKKACKKRAAELEDKELFNSGRHEHFEAPCAICQLPLPLSPDESMLNLCCCKTICNGCWIAASEAGRCHKYRSVLGLVSNFVYIICFRD